MTMEPVPRQDAPPEPHLALPEPASEVHFLDQTWVRRRLDGTLQVGVAIPPSEIDPSRPMRLVANGICVHEGLPLGSFFSSAGCHRLLPSPVSGRVLERNPGALRRLSHGHGRTDRLTWLVHIEPREKPTRASRREVVLVSQGDRPADRLSKQMTKLGCRVSIASDLDEGLKLTTRLGGGVCAVESRCFVQADSETIRSSAARTRPVKIMILNPEPTKQVLFRSCGISSYLEVPGRPGELFDELDRAFGPARRGITVAGEAHLDPWRNKISTTDRHGREIALFVSNELRAQFTGLGRQVAAALTGRHLPALIAPGNEARPEEIVRTEGPTHDRIVLLLPAKTGTIPGTIARVRSLSEEPAQEARCGQAIEVQITPAPEAYLPMVFDFKTTCALAHRAVEIALATDPEVPTGQPVH